MSINKIIIKVCLLINLKILNFTLNNCILCKFNQTLIYLVFFEKKQELYF
jgi:hypothetical protein